MLRKKRKWPVIVALIGTFLIIGISVNLLILSQHTLGKIELPAELPSPKMMAQIAANLELLSKPNGPFNRSDRLGIITALDYADENGLSIIITLESGAKPEDVLAAESTWQGKYVGFSDLLASIYGSGKYLLSFVGTQGPLTLVISQDDAATINTAPLEEALVLIQSVIGTY